MQYNKHIVIFYPQDMEAWVECIKNLSCQFDRRESKKSPTYKVQAGEQKIDQMLSDLVVYCQSVPFDFEGSQTHGFTAYYYHVSTLTLN